MPIVNLPLHGPTNEGLNQWKYVPNWKRIHRMSWCSNNMENSCDGGAAPESAGHQIAFCLHFNRHDAVAVLAQIIMFMGQWGKDEWWKLCILTGKYMK